MLLGPLAPGSLDAQSIADTADPLWVAATDPYALQPAGFFNRSPSAGLIDQPLFDGSRLRNSPLAPRNLFGSPTPYRGRMFLRADYLGWWMDSLDSPALVTTNPTGTPQNQAGFLGGSGTEVLFGDKLNDDFRSGLRLRGGWYVDPMRYWALGGDYYELFKGGDRFSAGGDGSPGSRILARPFFDIVGGQETSQFVNFPGVVSGDIAVRADTRMRSFGVNVQADAINAPGTPGQIASDCARQPRMDLIVGYRYFGLDDQISFVENLTQVPPPDTVSARESFDTQNRFQGLEFGYVREIPFGRWWFESVGRIAVGVNRQTVRIAGSTLLTEAGVPESFQGNLLAQRTNIGRHERRQFAIIPELGATLGFHVTPRMSLTAGYSLVYFSNVARAGDQIDTDVNPDLIPVEADPVSGALRPRFVFRQSDFFAHGLNFGTDFRF